MLIETASKNGCVIDPKAFLKMVKAQGGKIEQDEVVFKDENVYIKNVYAKETGFVKSIKTKQLGLISCEIGAGRMRKEDGINSNAGLYIYKKIGDFIKEDELLCTIYANDEVNTFICDKVVDCFELSIDKVDKEALIYKII